MLAADPPALFRRTRPGNVKADDLAGFGGVPVAIRTPSAGERDIGAVRTQSEPRKPRQH